uniref:Potassium/proton antiporter CemA n=2 Tax=Welwitschia mirabilis TaxID=3377 RepID=CEMA_WELMI|nr:envelope membrane protein [Welwitschia mirabilis]B2Y1X1.1 RecName: Full=Potassium/proton antiporter CemA; AltName: Full=Chloroplast envelope membrane protein A; Short=CemA [Welwitschia mirabilis]ABY26801.1 chloroplast envelope membrane protein [Welwitschia mirabilis]AMA21061.1 chloroplast envelope membrane protein [Welwitschia mirabilis]BAH11217.1 putative heme-binding protein [Welwitschia mirabilis]
MGLIPHSIIRTLSRLRTEFMSKSGPLVFYEMEVAKKRASASLRYLTCLLVLPWVISILLQKSIEPWVTFWWNTSSFDILDFLEEENTLVIFGQIEELLLFERMIENYSETYSKPSSKEIKKKTNVIKLYKKDCIHIITHLFTNFIGFALLSTYLVMGQKKLAIFFSWIREFFYSMSDTMKAFSILLATDLCIGFHSPHGWELLIDWISENYGFVHNDRIISSLVSTFPVILDTIFKYWIFRRFNRISPSLVVIYHSMNE